MPSMKEYRMTLNDQISKEIMAIRVPHTRATSESAMMIANKISGINKYDLHAACVLHDIAKELSYEMMVKIIINANGHPLLDEVIGDIDMSEYESQKWLHGIVGAIIAHDIYGITSPQVLKAIRYHKIGSLDDDIFTKVLITADVANDLRKARHMISAYTALKMRKYEIDEVYKNIVAYDTGLAITNDDIAIPRMIKGTKFIQEKLNTWKNIHRIGKFFHDDLEIVWMPVYRGDGKWERVVANGLYITPKAMDNAKIVLENIDLEATKGVVVTVSENDWSAYMVTEFVDGKFTHTMATIDDALRSGVKLPRNFYPKPTRLYSINMGEFQ